MNLPPLNPFAKSPTTRSRWIPQIGNELRPVFDRLAKALRLVARARSEGAENRPLQSDRDLDEPQRQIATEVQSGANLLKQFLASQLHDALEKIQARAPKPLDHSLALAKAHTEAAKAKLAQADALETARVNERRRFRTLRKFRMDNGLDREADYAQTWQLPAAVLLAIILAEAGGNTFLFMSGVDGGFIEAFLLAAMCSVANVVIGYGTGFFGLRLVIHVRPLLKAIGTLALISGTFLGVCLNFAIAHIRDVLERGETANAFLSSIRFLPSSEWFNFNGIESVALLLLGFAVFLIAMMKGRGGHSSHCDRYWDYESVDRAYRHAESIFDAHKEQYKSAVEDAFQAAQASLQAVHAANGTALQAIREIADHAEQRAAEVRDSIGEWAATGGALLRKYREENRAVRTAEAPAYFDMYPSFDDVGLGIADPASVRAAAETAIAIHEENAQQIAQLERELAAARHTAITEFLQEIDNIEERAARRIDQDLAPNDTKSNDNNQDKEAA